MAHSSVRESTSGQTGGKKFHLCCHLLGKVVSQNHGERGGVQRSLSEEVAV
jgi:hypothetical protein